MDRIVSKLPYTQILCVVTLEDPEGDLIGYGVCVEDADGFRLWPDVYSTRSTAFGEAEKYAAARENTEVTS